MERGLSIIPKREGIRGRQANKHEQTKQSVTAGRTTDQRNNNGCALRLATFALVRETMTADPFSGAVYVFRAKRADRIKLIFWDGTGLCLFAKRLEDGIFRWPKIEDGVMRLSAAQLSALLEGLDWRRVHEARETAKPTRPG